VCSFEHGSRLESRGRYSTPLNAAQTYTAQSTCFFEAPRSSKLCAIEYGGVSPPLRHREQTLRAELQAIADQLSDRAMFLRLAETLTAFLARLRSAADTLDVIERQRIVRLIVKEVLIGDDTITIRHCIPVAAPPPDRLPPTPGRPAGSPGSGNYLLRSGE
jgi:site-specific DNA recombinase